MSGALRCAGENAAIGARRSFVARWRDGVAETSGQVESYRRAWAAHNRAALDTDHGRLWVALGDSAAQGVGASTPYRGWVGQVGERLEDAGSDGWRVVNLSRSGARAHDVLHTQLPALWRLASGHPVALVVCAIGGNDMYRSTSRQVRDRFTRLVRGLPGPDDLMAGSRTVVTTLPQGLGRRRAGIANRIVAGRAPDRGLAVADLWATTGPPWQGKYAADQFHPNDRGYADWADAITPVAIDTVIRGYPDRTTGTQPGLEVEGSAETAGQAGVIQ